MKLGIINGSPRGKKSNSNTISDWITEDIKKYVDIKKVFAKDIKNHKKSIEDMCNCDYILMVFPLYTDAMSGYTKLFFENMERARDSFAGNPILFIIHSGFPEAAHSRLLERYCKHFSSIVGMDYKGCIILGGSEAIMHAPHQYFKKKIEALGSLGRKILTEETFSKEDVKLPGHKETLPLLTSFFLKTFPSLNDIFWNSQLKKNNAFEQRYARPYE